MLYALVSDVHANLPAWRAVLADLSSLGAERIVCLGDVVGYGPEPAAVLASMHRHVDAFVMGNHDAVLCGKMDAARFNSHARTMIEWSVDQVSRRGRDFLAAQSLALTGPGFCCAHGDLALPGAFRYIIEPRDAMASWEAAADPLIFVGHTHLSGIFVLGGSGTPHRLPAQDFVLEEGKRFIVNVGSVGYPRDGDARACYCLYDTAEKAVRWRRVPFDMEALRAAMVRARLNEEQVPLLSHDPLRQRRPVREELQFDPATESAQMAHGVTVTRDLTKLRRRLGRWRRLAGIGIGAALLATAAVAMLLQRPPLSGHAVPAAPLPPREAVVAYDLRGNLLPALPAVADGERLPGWRYTFSQPEAQHFEVDATPGEYVPRLRLVHSRPARCILEAPAWRLGGLAAGKLRAELLVRRGETFKGQVQVVVDTEGVTTDGQAHFHPGLLHFIPSMARRGGWEKGQATTARPLDAQTESVRFRIEAEFEGTLEIAEPRLGFQ